MPAPPLTSADAAEKGIGSPLDDSAEQKNHITDQKPPNFFTRLNTRSTNISFLEERGIQRVPDDARYNHSRIAYLQMSLLWFAINLTASNIALGLLGPLVYDLGFTDSALCSVFGGLLGSAGAAHMSTWGPRSGNRTMVVARYFMRYYPSKLACALNVIILLEHGLIDCLIGGQILSAVSGGGLSVVVGIIIVALISWVVDVFGMKVFYLYERWAGLPQFIVLCILFGVAGSKFDTSIQSVGDAATVNCDRLSFFSPCLSAPVAWAPSAADYFVYYPASTKPWKTFTMTFIGLGLANVMAYLLGVGMVSGTVSDPDWNDAHSISAGALLL